MFKKIVVVSLLFYVGVEGFFFLKNRDKTINIQETRVLESYKKIKGKDKPLILAKGKLSAKNPVKILGLISESDELLTAKVKVVTYQTVRSEIHDASSSRLIGYKYEDEFVEFNSAEWRHSKWQSDGRTNNNYDEWPVAWVSGYHKSKNLVFKDKFELDNEATERALGMYSLYTSYTSYFVPEKYKESLSMSNLKIDTNALRRGTLYYGKDHEKPEIGDVKIEIRVLETKNKDGGANGISKYKDFRLFGSYKENEIVPVNGYFYIFPAYIQRDETVLERIESSYNLRNNSFLFLWRVFFVLFGVGLLTYFVWNKRKT